MGSETVFVLNINVRRAAGHLYAVSPDLPGLHVCGDTEDGLRSSLVVAIKALFKANRALDVQVRPVAESLDGFPRDGRALARLAVLSC